MSLQPSLSTDHFFSCQFLSVHSLCTQHRIDFTEAQDVTRHKTSPSITKLVLDIQQGLPVKSCRYSDMSRISSPTPNRTVKLLGIPFFVQGCTDPTWFDVVQLSLVSTGLWGQDTNIIFGVEKWHSAFGKAF